MNSLGKIILALGAGLVFVGLILIVGEKFGLGKLPGDLFIRKGNFIFSFPIVSCIIISIILTIIFNLFRR